VDVTNTFETQQVTKRTETPGLSYAEFFNRFGGSYRTKHIQLGLQRRAAAMLGVGGRTLRVKQWAERARRAIRSDPRGAAGRFATRRTHAVARSVVPPPPAINRRPYQLPARSGLPPEFVRLDPWEGEYVFLLASRATAGIVETGRLRGGSTFLMACANREVPIFSIDIAPKDDGALSELMARHDIGRNIRLVVGDSQRTDYPEVEEVDLLFVDGDHSYDGCLRDLQNWFPKVVPGGHVVLHDCYFGSPVQDAAIDFARDHDVTLVRSPYIHALHWHNPTGSLAHFVKS
jgi:predicted O-methyltransferase YrrM